jgi:hypothetical protein
MAGEQRVERRKTRRRLNRFALGALAVFDNVVFHWLLEFHRFKDGWAGSVYVEVALVLLGGVMVGLGQG